MTHAAPTAFAHHSWANVRLLSACSSLSTEQLAETVPGTYGSILDTLRHVIGGDAAYLELLTDGSVAPLDESEMDVDELRDVAEHHAAVWQRLAVGDREPDEDVVRHNPEADSHAPLGVRLAQADASRDGASAPSRLEHAPRRSLSPLRRPGHRPGRGGPSG